MWLTRLILLCVGVLCCSLLGSWGCAQAPSSQEVASELGQETSVEKVAEIAGTQESGSIEEVTQSAPDATAPEQTNPADQISPPESVVEKQPPAAPYQIQLFDNIRINSRKEYQGKTYEHVRSATAAFELKDGPFAKVELVVKLRSTCYPFSQWANETIPTGHNWPPSCDAFDRNFEFVMDPPKQGEPPAIELVRAITPFGGPMDFTIDITDVANLRQGKHSIQVGISTWSDGNGKVSGANGGWFLTASLQVTPGQPAQKVLAVIPLVNGTYKHNDSKKVETKFTLPEGTKRTVLEYRVTGHGGGSVERPACIGPADEFCKRVHRLYADGKEYQQFTPWRSDCANFCNLINTQFGQRCKENPCGALQSVRAPRANWCPGSITGPIRREIPAFQTPGEHTFGYQIDKVGKGGSWRVSVVIIAYGQ